MSNTTLILLSALAAVLCLICFVVGIRSAIQRSPGTSLTPRTRVLVGVLAAATLGIGVLLLIEGIHRLSRT